ncbi:hypothetical protein JTB14_004862 [Gonioctena quinquepunctata]|nr:hypothetical protein JTB14_004862 [Gonioctena quinquepunctata]
MTIVLAKNSQTSKKISLIPILYFQGKQVFPKQQLRRGDRIRRPPQTHGDYVSYSSFVENFSIPTFVEEVLASPDKGNWLKAMDREYKAQIDNGTWELVDLPSD